MTIRSRCQLVVAIAFGAALTVAGASPAFADTAKGKQLYKDKQCSMCHRINESGGKKGPALDDVGNTRDTAWLEKYLVNPKSIMPKGTMPPAKVTPSELLELIDYLGTLKVGATTSLVSGRG